VLLEVLAHVPTDLFHCRHCEQFFSAAGIGAAVHEEVRASYPDAMLEEAARLAALLQGLLARHGGRLEVRVVDVGSVEGLVKSLRYGVRRYPGFVIDRRKRVTGWHAETLLRMVGDAIESSVSE
jgi:hypothetical protein